MKLRTPYQTAVILVLILSRSGLARARISTKTMKLCSGRKNIHSTFISSVYGHLLSDFDIVLFEMNNGGYGIFKASSFAGAKSITAKKNLEKDEMTQIKTGSFDYEAAEGELLQEVFEENDSDE